MLFGNHPIKCPSQLQLMEIIPFKNRLQKNKKFKKQNW